jgi:HEAT repeat protein
MDQHQSEVLADLIRNDPDAAVRQEVALALGGGARTNPGLIEELERACDDPSDAVRRGAVLALGASRRPEAVEPILRAVEEHPELWSAAAAALVTLGDKSVCDRLIELLTSSDQPRVRRAAARAIAGFEVGPMPLVNDPLNAYQDEGGEVHVLV